MYPERATTIANISQLKIPHNVISTLGGVSKSRVSEYVKHINISGRVSSLIEQTVKDISDLVLLTENEFGFSPNLSDIPKLKELLEGLQQARYLAAQSQLQRAGAEVSEVLKEFAAQQI